MLVVGFAGAGCAPEASAEDAQMLRAVIDAVLDGDDVGLGAVMLPSPTVAVFERFLNKREGLPMYPGQGDVAFETEPVAALSEAAELVPQLDVCGRPDECVSGGSVPRILALTRPVLRQDRAAVFVLDAADAYLNEYLVTLERVGRQWAVVSVRLTNREH